MFGSQILEVVIGMVFVYFVLSMISSAVNEWIASRLGMRAKFLEKAIRNLLTHPASDTTKEDTASAGSFAVVKKLFYEHHLIKGLMDGNKLPSYIPANIFSSVLLEIVKRAPTASGDKTNTILALPEGKLRDLLVNFAKNAETNLEQARVEVETWFNGTMERASGWYKRQIQWIILLISLGVSGFLNADSFTIANALWNNGNLRAAVVASAQKAVANPSPTAPNASSKSIEELRSELQSLNLPIGWVLQQESTDKQKALLNDPRALPNTVGGWIYKIAGIIFTAIAASQGAPFWFDLLNKFIDLRGVGKKPEEKKDK